MQKTADYAGLLPFAETERQREVIAALISEGSVRRAAVKVGINKSNVSGIVARVRALAARQGYSPPHDMTHVVPDGYVVRGVSTYYDAKGKPRGQWVKSREDLDRQRELMRAAVAGFCEELVPALPVEGPEVTVASLCNLYVVTDYHLGMMSWPEETGDDWNVKIAEDLLLSWFARAIELAPAAEVGILANLGDFLHFDGLKAVTPVNAHVLDADTRFQKVVRIAIRLFRTVISLLLKKHRHVHIVHADANHDPASGAWLREMFYAFYENEPRITVDRSADTYYCFEWGQTSLFFHHGHVRSPNDVDDVFVAKYREVFGRTKHSYGHMGHLHHVDIKETNLMLVEQHRTLAAKDAYASRGGWMAGRDAKVITYSRDFGEVGRLTITPEMVGHAAKTIAGEGC